MRTSIYNKTRLKLRRRMLRLNMTAPEKMVWRRLRNGHLKVKFRRQFSVSNYILDFYSPAIKLAIEIDGDSHYKQGYREKDMSRDARLAELGIEVLRFTNAEVQENLDGVLERIMDEIRERFSTTTPTSSPLRMRGRAHHPHQLPLSKGEGEGVG